MGSRGMGASMHAYANNDNQPREDTESTEICTIDSVSSVCSVVYIHWRAWRRLPSAPSHPKPQREGARVQEGVVRAKEEAWNYRIGNERFYRLELTSHILTVRRARYEPHAGIVSEKKRTADKRG